MKKTRRVAALLLATCAFAASVAPAFADPGGGPGSNSGCPGHQPPPPPNHNCGH
jgi:hypothetical protein